MQDELGLATMATPPCLSFVETPWAVSFWKNQPQSSPPGAVTSSASPATSPVKCAMGAELALRRAIRELP